MRHALNGWGDLQLQEMSQTTLKPKKMLLDKSSSPSPPVLLVVCCVELVDQLIHSAAIV